MKKSRILYNCWLVFAAIMIIVYALEYDSIRRHIYLPGAARTGGLLVFALADIFCVLVSATGHISWSESVREEEEKILPRSRRTIISLRRLVFFILATAVYSYYCFGLSEFLNSNTYRDSIVAGGLLCLAAAADIKQTQDGAKQLTISDF